MSPPPEGSSLSPHCENNDSLRELFAQVVDFLDEIHPPCEGRCQRPVGEETQGPPHAVLFFLSVSGALLPCAKRGVKFAVSDPRNDFHRGMLQMRAGLSVFFPSRQGAVSFGVQYFKNTCLHLGHLILVVQNSVQPAMKSACKHSRQPALHDHSPLLLHLLRLKVECGPLVEGPDHALQRPQDERAFHSRPLLLPVNNECSPGVVRRRKRSVKPESQSTVGLSLLEQGVLHSLAPLVKSRAERSVDPPENGAPDPRLLGGKVRPLGKCLAHLPIQEEHGSLVQPFFTRCKLQGPDVPPLESARQGSVFPSLHGFLKLLFQLKNFNMAFDPPAERAGNAAIDPESEASAGGHTLLLLLDNEADPRPPCSGVRKILEVEKSLLHDLRLLLRLEQEFDPPGKGRSQCRLSPVSQSFSAMARLRDIVVPRVEGGRQTHEGPAPGNLLSHRAKPLLAFDLIL